MNTKLMGSFFINGCFRIDRVPLLLPGSQPASGYTTGFGLALSQESHML